MVDLEVIKKAIAGVENLRTGLQGKKTTKAIAKRIEDLEIKEGNLEQFKKVIEEGESLVGMYVATDIGAEVGQIIGIEGTQVEVEYLDGETKINSISDLMYDAKATIEKVDAESTIKVKESNQVHHLTRLLYPGQVELDGVAGLLSASEWEKHDSAVGEEVPDINFVEITHDFVEGNYRFLIGRVSELLFAGQLFEDKGRGIQELVLQTQSSLRCHWVRSVLAKKYHSLVRFLIAGNKISVKPSLLAFAPENQEAYHPSSEEEDVSDILEDLQGGKGILQRIGVSDEGEIFSGYRRALAAIKAGLEEVPVEVTHFDNRADFIEALFNANKQREKTPEIKAREREIRHKYCSEEARASQLSALNTGIEASKTRGSAWERAVANEPDISPATAIAQSKIIRWADSTKDRELSKKVMSLFNSGEKKTKTCLDIIEYAEQSPEEAKKIADMILEGDASSVSKAIAKAGLPSSSPLNIPNTSAALSTRGVHVTPSGATPASTLSVGQGQDGRRVLPDWIIRLAAKVLEIDASTALSTSATPAASAEAFFHLSTDANASTAASAEAFALASQSVEWMFSGKKQEEWARLVSARWMQGNIVQGIIFLKPSSATRLIFKGIASANAEILEPIEFRTTEGKFHSEVEGVVGYYFGDNWKAFHDAFDKYADVRIARWAFDSGVDTPEEDKVFWQAFDKHADARIAHWASSSGVNTSEEVEGSEAEVFWRGNSVGQTATYKEIRLMVIRAVDDTWFVELDEEKVAEGLPDIALAKAIAINTANERTA